MALVSVVIPNFNGMRYLDRCLSSLSQQTYRDFEVIVVDNASSDGSVECLTARFPWVKVIENKVNLGFAAGTNVGIRQSRGDFILTLNNDTSVDCHFIEYLIKPMLDGSVGSCASKMLFPDGRINSTGICISRSGAAWDRGMFEPDEGQYDSAEEIFGPCAGAALYRKRMLDDIGLFDEDFFLYMEDVDLAFRAQLAGWRCDYVPSAKVIHLHGGTAVPGSDLSVYYGNRNIIWYVLKDFPTWILIRSLFWVLGRNLIVIPYYALRGKGRVIVKSKFDAVKGAPVMLRKRSEVVRRTPDQEIWRYMKTLSKIPRQKNVVRRV
jgi:GT2 family glycosyltransferase